MDRSPEELADLEFSVREWSGIDEPFYWGTVTHTPSKLYAMGVGTSALEAMAKALEKYRQGERSLPIKDPLPPVSEDYFESIYKNRPTVLKSRQFYDYGLIATLDFQTMWVVDVV